MQARDIMTSPVITFRPDTTARQAAAVLSSKQITAAPVVDDADEIVGMVSEGDLIADRFAHDPRSHARRDGDDAEPAPPQSVAGLMTTPVVAMSAGADAADLADAMFRYDVRSIPIIEGSTVVGIVSRRDLLRTLVRDDHVIAAEVRHRIDAYADAHTSWEVLVTDGRVAVFGPVEDDAEHRILEILARAVPGVAHADVYRRQPAHRQQPSSHLPAGQP